MCSLCSGPHLEHQQPVESSCLQGYSTLATTLKLDVCSDHVLHHQIAPSTVQLRQPVAQSPHSRHTTPSLYTQTGPALQHGHQLLCCAAHCNLQDMPHGVNTGPPPTAEPSLQHTSGTDTAQAGMHKQFCRTAHCRLHETPHEESNRCATQTTQTPHSTLELGTDALQANMHSTLQTAENAIWMIPTRRQLGSQSPQSTLKQRTDATQASMHNSLAAWHSTAHSATGRIPNQTKDCDLPDEHQRHKQQGGAVAPAAVNPLPSAPQCPPLQTTTYHSSVDHYVPRSVDHNRYPAAFTP